jgi:hypothetical protein
VYQQHVIDWWRVKGYRVTVLTDWSLMCISEAAFLGPGDPENIAAAIRRRYAAAAKK